MPDRKITVDGKEWRVFPSGFITQYDQDEFGLFFSNGTGTDREIRVTRYSPQGVRSREAHASASAASSELSGKMTREARPPARLLASARND